MKHRVFVFDPNWASDDGGGGRGAQNHYDLSTTDAIGTRIRMHSTWSETGPVLAFVWVTRSAYREGEAQVLARLLGCRICSDFVWAKVDPMRAKIAGVEVQLTNGHIDALGWSPPRMKGLGFWSRSEHEILLVFGREVDVPQPPSVRPRSMIYAPRVRRGGKDKVANKVVHSAKPERAWTQVIEPLARAVMPGEIGVEFNSRQQRPGWAAVGRLNKDGTFAGEKAPLVYVPAKEAA